MILVECCLNYYNDIAHELHPFVDVELQLGAPCVPIEVVAVTDHVARPHHLLQSVGAVDFQ